jgi:hypothetical protein
MPWEPPTTNMQCTHGVSNLDSECVSVGCEKALANPTHSPTDVCNMACCSLCTCHHENTLPHMPVAGDIVMVLLFVYMPPRAHPATHAESCVLPEIKASHTHHNTCTRQNTHGRALNTELYCTKKRSPANTPGVPLSQQTRAFGNRLHLIMDPSSRASACTPFSCPNEASSHAPADALCIRRHTHLLHITPSS